MNNRSNTIFITGSPGVGKTTIANMLSTKEYSVFNAGTLMNEIAVREGLVDNRDEIRTLDPKKSTELRRRMAESISDVDGIKIVDTQISVAYEGRYTAGIPIELMDRIKDLSLIIYIDATKEEIKKRRFKDKTRIRENEDDEIIDVQRSINIGILSYYLVRLNIPVYFVHNKENDLEGTVKKCEDAIKSI